LADPDPPGIDLTGSILTLTFTGTTPSGVTWKYLPGLLPLKDDSGRALHLFTNNPDAKTVSSFDNVVNMVFVRKAATVILLYLIIRRALWGWGSGDSGFDLYRTYYSAWKYIGTGVYSINLLNYFQQVAEHFNLGTDPAGWGAEMIELAHRTVRPLFDGYLKNDYIGLYYQ